MQLGFNRRANDGCILALISLMSDMMQPFSQLPNGKLSESCTITLDSVLAKMKVGFMLIVYHNTDVYVHTASNQ